MIDGNIVHSEHFCASKTIIDTSVMWNISYMQTIAAHSSWFWSIRKYEFNHAKCQRAEVAWVLQCVESMIARSAVPQQGWRCATVAPSWRWSHPLHWMCTRPPGEEEASSLLPHWPCTGPDPAQGQGCTDPLGRGPASPPRSP